MTHSKRQLPPLVTLSTSAIVHLRKILMNEDGNQKYLRLSVQTKGCSGLSYDMQWVEHPLPGDQQIQMDEITFFIDPKATLFIAGTTMDWEEKNLSSGFVFKNPNEKGRCGCGESFHV